MIRDRGCYVNERKYLVLWFSVYLVILWQLVIQSRRATGGGGVGRHPLPFFENRKHWSDFGKKGPDCVHLWVKFSIQNVVLKVSRRKKSQIFPCGSFFLLFLTKCLSKCPSFTKPPLPWKFFGCAPANSQLNVFPNYLIQTI